MFYNNSKNNSMATMLVIYTLLYILFYSIQPYYFQPNSNGRDSPFKVLYSVSRDKNSQLYKIVMWQINSMQLKWKLNLPFLCVNNFNPWRQVTANLSPSAYVSNRLSEDISWFYLIKKSPNRRYYNWSVICLLGLGYLGICHFRELFFSN
jgi:hypothetical protein